MIDKNDIKVFHIAEILGAATGYLYAKSIPVNHNNHPIGGIYEILDWMTNDELYTHQLPRVSHECKPYLMEQFTWLADIIPYPKDSSGDWDKGWKISYDALQGYIEKYGEYHEVRRIHPEDHENIDPSDELQKLVPKDKIITVILDDEPSDIGDINWNNQ